MKLIPLALCLLLGLPALGYLWPLPDPEGVAASEDHWSWPSADERKQADIPEKLTTFWPGRAPLSPEEAAAASEAEKARAARHAWSLIGVIRQGRHFNALVQDPQNNILTLNPGDALDEDRKVSTIEPTRLRWQDAAGQTGELPLYPEPDVAPTAPVDDPRAAAKTETQE